MCNVYTERRAGGVYSVPNNNTLTFCTQAGEISPRRRLKRWPLFPVGALTSLLAPSTPPKKIPTEYMIIVESATWRIGCKHPRERGREAGSSELLYQLDGRCYFLSRQPISVRSVKDGHRTTEVRQETTPDSIMSFVGAYVHKYTNRNTHKHKFWSFCTIQQRGIKCPYPANPMSLHE